MCLQTRFFLSDLILNDQIFLGYSGSNCQIDPCSHKPCLKDGKCSVVPDGASVKYECTCKQGYTGTDCQNTPCYNVNCQVLKSLSPLLFHVSDLILISANNKIEIKKFKNDLIIQFSAWWNLFC